MRNKVTEEEIAEVVSKWTHIPVSKMLEGEREKLLHMEDALHKRVIGQDEASYCCMQMPFVVHVQDYQILIVRLVHFYF